LALLVRRAGEVLLINHKRSFDDARPHSDAKTRGEPWHHARVERVNTVAALGQNGALGKAREDGVTGDERNHGRKITRVRGVNESLHHRGRHGVGPPRQTARVVHV